MEQPHNSDVKKPAAAVSHHCLWRTLDVENPLCIIVQTQLEPIGDPNANRGIECVRCHANHDDGLNEQLFGDQYGG